MLRSMEDGEKPLLGRRVAGLGLAYALGPRRSLAWGAKGLAAWRLWRNLRGGGA